MLQSLCDGFRKMGHKCYKIRAVWCPKPITLLWFDKGQTVLGPFIANSSRSFRRSETLSCEGTRRPILTFLFLSRRVQLSQSYLPFSPMLQKQLTPFLPVQTTVASMSRLGSWYHLSSYSTY
jgi:hypothetical protein